jgi:hypothetical protein
MFDGAGGTAIGHKNIYMLGHLAFSYQNKKYRCAWTEIPGKGQKVRVSNFHPTEDAFPDEVIFIMNERTGHFHYACSEDQRPLYLAILKALEKGMKKK